MNSKQSPADGRQATILTVFCPVSLDAREHAGARRTHGHAVLAQSRDRGRPLRGRDDSGAYRRLAARARPLPPEAATRYRVLRRSITAAILVVGFCSALLVIPQVRAIAGGLLASSAVLGVIIGFASQRTLGNFVAGLLIAIAQPVRLGDRVEVDGAKGSSRRSGSPTRYPGQDDARIVIPNEKLASDTIRNSTIRSREKVAEITVQVPLSTDLDRIVGSLRALLDGERDPTVFVSSLDGNATVTMPPGRADEDAAQQLERELRAAGSCGASRRRRVRVMSPPPRGSGGSAVRTSRPALRAGASASGSVSGTAVIAALFSSASSSAFR